jgi:hypothetical protein
MEHAGQAILFLTYYPGANGEQNVVGPAADLAHQALAITYAIHVLDTYDQYVMRAKLQEERRQALIKTGREPAATSGGFAFSSSSWRSRFVSDSIYPAYFLRKLLGRLADPGLATHFADRRSILSLIQHEGDLRLRKLRRLHRSLRLLAL